MKKIIMFLIPFLSMINASALTYGGCEYSVVSRMKSIVKNVNISYDYKIINNEAYFDVTINNLTDDIYLYDVKNDKKYYYKDTFNGELVINNYKVNSGSYRFYSNKKECYGISLGVKYYNFPHYNKYYTHFLCEDITDYSLCKKWAKINYSEVEFEEYILNYKNKKEESEEETVEVVYEKTFFDKLIQIYIDYYYYFLGGLIIIFTPIIIIYNKKNRFNL